MLALADCATAVEREIVDDWLRDAGRPDEVIPLLRPSGATSVAARRLDRALADDTTEVVPVRVAWLPEERGGTRRARLSDLLPGRNPYRPPARRQRAIAARHPDRSRVVVGESATVGEMREQWVLAEGGRGEFADYVVRRALLALEHAQYRLLGPEYKAPRLVKEEMLSSARFRAGLERASGKELDDEAIANVEVMLDELVTGWGPLFIDAIPSSGRMIYRRGFEAEIDYDHNQVERVRDALAQHSTVMLMSHRSNLDASILTIAMRENNMPRAHGFAGINMAFWPMGPIMRRAGVIFIRRDTSSDPVYRYVLREYVGYLVEKRFNMHWSIEGTRSRTGKMLPPKLGLLSYVAGAYLDGRTDDVMLLPVSISFDQLFEIGEYAEYARGAEKRPEGIGWFVRFIRDQGAGHFGKIYVRYAEPVSMRHFLGPVDEGVERDESAVRLALQKMAFEVAWRMNRETPVNATALVTTFLLASRGAAVTMSQIRIGLAEGLSYLRAHDVPMTVSARALDSEDGVLAALSALASGGPVTRFDRGAEPVWSIEAPDQLAATFYRNSLVHYFLESAICELALLAAADAAHDPAAVFWHEVHRLRDLLKFEFYFQEREEYVASIGREMERVDPDWTAQLEAGPVAIEGLLDNIRPLMSAIVLRPFLEAYLIMADTLVQHLGENHQRALIEQALGLGRQYQMQRRVASDEPVSVLLFKTALSLADNRGLLDDADAADVAAGRVAFATEVHAVLRRIVRLEHVARARFVAESRPASSPAPVQRLVESS